MSTQAVGHKTGAYMFDCICGRGVIEELLRLTQAEPIVPGCNEDDSRINSFYWDVCLSDIDEGCYGCALLMQMKVVANDRGRYL